jgi:predicted dehydrogenase
MGKVKIGIVGFGRMGMTHYSIINTHPDVEIVSVADTSKVLLDVLKKYIEGIKIYTDYKQLIDESKPDGIIICTPPHLHYSVIKYAYEKGVHVFCEKPFTADYQQAKELSELFRNSNLVNQIGYANRERDVFNEMKKHLNNQLIGNIYHYKAQMMSSAIIKKTTDNSWRDKKENGGGVVYEMASHLIDMTHYFFGSPQKIIGSSACKIFSNNVDDMITSNFIYGNGITGSIYVNWSDPSYRKASLSFEILGDKGKMVGDFYGYKIFLNQDNKDLNLRQGWNTFNLTDIYKPVPFYVRGNEFTAQLYRFVDLITGKEKKNLCDFSEALKVHRVIDEIDKDLNLNKIENNGKD